MLADQVERQQAIDPRASFIVQAPAGSGKTELLTQRFLKLLAYVQQPEEIIALTFTRRAASEMRHRIIHALQQAQLPAPKQQPQRLSWQLAKTALQHSQKLNWNLLANPNRLRIITIDALAGSLSKALPTYTELVSHATIHPRPDILYQQAASQLLAELNNPDDLDNRDSTAAALYQLLDYYDNQPDKIIQLLCNMLPCRDQWLHYIMQPDAATRELLEAPLQQLASDRIKNVIKTWQAATCGFSLDELTELARYAANHLEIINNQHPLLALSSLDTDKSLAQYCAAEDLARWQAVTQLLLTDKNELRKTVQHKQGFPSPSSTKDPAEKAHRKQLKQRMLQLLATLSEQPQLLSALIILKQCPHANYSDAQWATLANLCGLLPRCVAHLQLVFQQRQAIDFVEVNLQAQRALGSAENPTDLALQLDYQIKHLLIDEFQDTAYLHYHFIQQLIAGWEIDDGRTLFIVGDPMQSIYRFRDAEVSLFTRTQQLGIANLQLKSLHLSCNFRTVAPLLNWINRACTNFFPSQDDMQASAVSYTPAVAMKQGAEYSVEQAITNTHGGENPLQEPQWVCLQATNREQAAMLQAAYIAQQIIKLRQQQPTAEIAILVRSRHHLSYICPLLRRLNIDFQAVDIERLGQHHAVQDLLTLCQALCQVDDELAWYSLLRGPYCGLSLRSLVELQTAYQKSQHTLFSEFLLAPFQAQTIEAKLYQLSDNSEQQRITVCLHVLAKTLQQPASYRFRTWLENCWLALQGPCTLTDANDLTYCSAFFELVEQLDEHTGSLDCDQLAARLATAFINTPQADSQQPPVQIMTIHKAKGLEFDYVFMPNLEARPIPLAHRMLRWSQQQHPQHGEQFILAPLPKTDGSQTDSIYHYLRDQEQNKQNTELCRLLYVALTRAKQQLFLCYTQLIDDDLDSMPKSSYTETNPSQSASIKPHNNAKNIFSRGSFAYFLADFIPSQAGITHCEASLQTILKQMDDKSSTQETVALKRLTIESIIKVSTPSQAAKSIATKKPAATHLNRPHMPHIQTQIGTLLHALLAKLSTCPTTVWPRVIQQQQAHWRQALSAYANPVQRQQALEIMEYCSNQLRICPYARWILASQQHQACLSEQAFTVYDTKLPRQFIIDRSFVCSQDYQQQALANPQRYVIDYKCTLPISIDYPQLLAAYQTLKPSTAAIKQPTKFSLQSKTTALPLLIQLYHSELSQHLLTQAECIDFVSQQIKQHTPQLEHYASLIQSENSQPYTLGIYFPLLQLWCQWSHQAISCTTAEKILDSSF